MDHDILKYGDLITIYGFLPSEIFKPLPASRNDLGAENTNAGFLSAIGFTDTRVFLQKIPQGEDPSTISSEFSNNKQLVFQVWPKLICEAHKQMRKLLKEKALVWDALDKEGKEAFEIAVGKLGVRVSEELRAHQRILNQVAGNSIVYGSEVQFMHLNSKAFLKAETSCSTLDRNAYKFELSTEFSSRMAFRISPKYNLRQEGEPVQFGDEILIHNSKLDCYVNFSLNSHVEIDTNMEIPTNLPVISKNYEYHRLNKGSKRYEAHVSQFKDAIWRFHFYGSPKEEEEPIIVRGGDIIRLKHSENSAYLAADVCMRTEDPEVFGRVYYGEHQEENDCVNTLWQVEINDAKNRHGECQIINEKKEYISIRLRHLVTGRVIHYGSLNMDKQTWKIPILTQDNKAGSNYSIILHSFANNPKKELYYNTAYALGLKSESLAVVRSGNNNPEGSCRFITMHTDKTYNLEEEDGEGSLNRSPKKGSLGEHVKIFKPLNDEEFTIKKRVIILESMSPSAEHAFIIQRVDREREAEIAFAASTIPLLGYFRDALKVSFTYYDMPHDTVSRAISVLQALILYIYKAEDKPIKHPELLKFKGTPVPVRQKLLKDFGLIDILTEILYYPFYYNIFTLQQISDLNFVIVSLLLLVIITYGKVFQYCYILIRHVISEYRPNELYASQWLEFYMNQTLAPDNVDIKAEVTLTELIDNNKRILNTKVDLGTIKKFVHMLRTTKKTKFVNLLQALIVCEEQPVLKNQNVTARLIFDDMKAREELVPMLRITKNEVEILWSDYSVGNVPEWISFSKFHTLSHKHDNGQRFEYFISLVYLFANLCLDRNYIAIDYLEKIYTYWICFKMMSDEVIYKGLWSLKSAFARLINTLWLDRKPYHPIQLPRRIVSWEDVAAVEGLVLSHNTNGFEELIRFLHEHFTTLSEEGCTKIYELERNKFTLISLDLIIRLASFGFYSTPDKIKTLVKPLLVLLNGMVDAMTKTEYEVFAQSLERKSKSGSSGMRTSKRGNTRAVKRGRTAMMANEEIKKKSGLKYKEAEDTLVVMNCKSKICEIIMIMMSIDNDLLMRRFLIEYKTRLEGLAAGSLNKLKMSQMATSEGALLGRMQMFTMKSDKNHEMKPQSSARIMANIEEIKKICEKDSLNIGDLAPTSFVKILFNLLRYEHEELVAQAFELMYLNYSKQLLLKNSLSQIRIVETKRKRDAIKDIQDKVRELNELSETAENWYASPISQSYQREFNRYIEIIKGLAEYMGPEGVDRLIEPDKGGLEDDEEGKSLMDRQGLEIEEIGMNSVVVNREFQQILRHLRAHEPMVYLLKFEYSDFEKKKTEQQTKLLREISKFLTRLTFKDPVAQEMLCEEKMLFFKLLKNYHDIGIENLIEELFRNNGKMIKNFEHVQKFAADVIKILKIEGLTTYKNSRLLKTLNVLMRHQNKTLKQNQIIIMSLITSRENVPIFFDFLYERQDELEDMLLEYDRRVAEVSEEGGVVQLPPELDCIASLILLMATAADGKNVVTESKIQGLFTLENSEVVLIYSMSKHCWHIKYALLVLVHSIYIDTERERKDDLEKLSKFLERIAPDMVYLTEKRETYEIISHKGRVKSNIIEENVYYKAILPCIDEMLIKKIYKNIPNYSKILSDMLQNLLLNKEYIKDSYSRKMKATVSLFKLNVPEIYSQVNASLKLAPVNVSLEIPDNVILQDTLTMLVKEDDSNAQQLKKLITRVNQNPNYITNVEKEFEKMIDALANLDNVSDKDPFCSNLPFGDVMKSLIQIMDSQEVEVSKDLKLIGLKIFRKIIEYENKSYVTPAADWTHAMWIKDEKKIITKQNKLCQLGGVEMACNVIAHHKDIDIQHEALLVCIALLLGGNINAQEEFFDYMQKDFENTFMFSIKDLIAQNFETVKKGLNEKNRSYLKRMQIILEQEKRNIKRNSGASRNSVMKLVDESEEESLLNDVGLHVEYEKGYFQELSNSLLVLKRVYIFFQLLCEGHNFELQSQLRCQKTESGLVNRKTYDFIMHTAYFFNALLKQINVDSIELSVQILEFLISAIRGPCEENQIALVKSNIINSAMDFVTMFQKRNDFMKRGFFTPAEIERLSSLSITCMKLLNALIEGNTNLEIVEEMNSLNFKFLIEKITQAYSNFVKKKLKCNPVNTQPMQITMKLNKNSYDKEILEAFDIYLFLATLSGHCEKAEDAIDPAQADEDLTFNALTFFQINTAHIEILFREKLLKTYFPIYPACRYLSDGTRKDLMQRVKRESPNEKITGLLHAVPELFAEMEHLAYLKSLFFHISISRYNFLRDLSTLFSFLINLLFLTTTSYGVSEGDSVRVDEDIGPISSLVVGMTLNYLQIVTSSLMAMFWLIIFAPTILHVQWNDLIHNKGLSTEEEVRLSKLLDERPLGSLPLRTVLNLLWRKGPYDPIFNKNGKRNFGHPFVRLTWFYKNIIFIFSDGRFIFQLFYFAVSVLGFSISEICFCLHLLDVINRFDTLRNVIKSVTFNIRQLALTGLMGLILIYIYSLIGFVFLDDQYFDSDSNERSCSSMIQCYVTTINLGLRNGGGIGESLERPSYNPLVTYYFRFVFDLTFFIIINIIFLNIIFGIIIDTFAELRDRKKTIEEDMRNVCFICSLSRSKIDKDGDGFDVHIKNNHNLWNYVFYIYYLHQKDTREHGGVETYVKQSLACGDVTWFPLERSIEMEDDDSADKSKRSTHYHFRNMHRHM